MPTKDPAKLKAIRRTYYLNHGQEKKIRALTGLPRAKAASPEALESARRMLARATEGARYGYTGKLTPGGF
jgi:hypothetical protein